MTSSEHDGVGPAPTVQLRKPGIMFTRRKDPSHPAELQGPATEESRTLDILLKADVQEQRTCTRSPMRRSMSDRRLPSVSMAVAAAGKQLGQSPLASRCTGSSAPPTSTGSQVPGTSKVTPYRSCPIQDMACSTKL